MRNIIQRWTLWACTLLLAGAAQAESPVYYFSVLNQRSPSLTAQYWNPILAYVSKKADVDLKLKMGKTAPETTALTVRGEAQFAYTNHFFTPERMKLGWRVIARPDTDGIRGQLVVSEESPVRGIDGLQGLAVAFPSAESFVGFKVPMNALLQKGIQIIPLYSSNQEGAIGLLKSGRAMAAGVNEDVMAAYGKRESFRYRVLWSSESYNDLAIMANPNFVSESTIRAVRQAFVEMRNDSEGKKILAQGAELLKLTQAGGFLAASDGDYENYRKFHREKLLKE